MRKCEWERKERKWNRECETLNLQLNESEERRWWEERKKDRKGERERKRSSSDLFVGQVFPIQSESKKDRTTFLGQEEREREILVDSREDVHSCRKKHYREKSNEIKGRERELRKWKLFSKREKEGEEESSKDVFLSLHLLSFFSRFNFYSNGSWLTSLSPYTLFTLTFSRSSIHPLINLIPLLKIIIVTSGNFSIPVNLKL